MTDRERLAAMAVERNKYRDALDRIVRTKFISRAAAGEYLPRKKSRVCPYCGVDALTVKGFGWVRHDDDCPVFIASNALQLWIPTNEGHDGFAPPKGSR